MSYLVVIGDVVASRAAAHRGELQRSLAAAVERANFASRDRLASPFTITLGDEFQAVYAKPRGFFDDIWPLLEALHPVKLRVAAGLGGILTPLNARQAIGMDGPSFHRARHAMDGLKRERESIIQVEAGEGELALANCALRLACRLLARWRRESLSTLVCLAQGLPVEEIARRLKVTPRAVFKRIRAGSLREVLAVVRAVEAEMEAVLARVDEGGMEGADER